MSLTGIRGNRAENLALEYLRKQQLSLQQRNFSARSGEIDLIMLDDDYLVFIEVRYRKGQQYGGALESIDWRKQRKLRRTAELYLMQQKLADQACRFDILCLSGNLADPTFQWIKNAF